MLAEILVEFGVRVAEHRRVFRVERNIDHIRERGEDGYFGELGDASNHREADEVGGVLELGVERGEAVADGDGEVGVFERLGDRVVVFVDEDDDLARLAPRRERRHGICEIDRLVLCVVVVAISGRFKARFYDIRERRFELFERGRRHAAEVER